MFFAADVQYREDDTATAAGLLFGDWQAAEPARVILKDIAGVAPYEPGQFYKRELPCLLTVLEDALESASEPVDAIVVDGYVFLGPEQRPGLGMHLYEALTLKVPVIGVAKRSFAGTPEDCQVFRGGSETPLFVSAVGMALSAAKAHIQAMHGQHRIPTLLKRVDQLCRGINV